jgi:inosose dehydratase
MTRRELLAAGMAASLCSAAASESRLAVEGYIFQQYAQSRKQPLEAVTGEVLPMARAAGFRNIELNPAFFAPETRPQVLSLLESEGLRMPSVYVGGAMHEKAAADRTIATALEIGGVCRRFGCKAIVNNPDPKPGNISKTDAELEVQAAALNRMGRRLAQHGFDLRVHHHTPQLAENAREWRHILRHTDPEVVHICVDVDWAYEGGFEPVPFLRETGKRLREIHVRSARNKIWLEDLEDSDIDYRQVAGYLKTEGLAPLIVVELAYRPQTQVTRPLEEDLRLSRLYAERIFGVKANAS